MKAKDSVKMISPKQLQYLHVLFRNLHWNKDMYKDMLERNFNVSSTKDLTLGEANNCIALLQKILAELDPSVTKKQAYTIRKLWAEIDYSGGKEGDTHLDKFLTKFYKKETVEELTKQEAIKVIRQIKQMTKQAEKRKGKTTVLKRRTQCANCGAWIMWVQLADGRREAFDCDEYRNATNFHTC